MTNNLSVSNIPDKHLSADVMYQYLDNQLTPAQQHEVERHLLACNFCNEALTGLGTTTREQTQHKLFEINYHLKSRSQPRHPNGILVHLKNWGLTTGILFLVIVAALMVWYQVKKVQPKTAPAVDVTTAVPVSARPRMGEENYRQYLAEQLNKLALNPPASLSGEIVVGFTVNPDGSISNLKIIKGLAPHLNRTALRLIKEGPAWEPARHPEKPVAENKTISIPVGLTK